MLSRIFRIQTFKLIALRPFSAVASDLIAKDKNAGQSGSVTYQYIDNQLTPVNQLVLRTRQSMEEYVMKTIKDYFRTSNRNSLTLDSILDEHSLDSLDCVEVAMQIETDLGYLIPSENLPAFSKPIHFVNYIEQVENFKTIYGKNPMP